LEEGDDLGGELLGGAEALGEEHHLGDELPVRGGHGERAEQLLQVVRQVGTPGIARVHGDEDGHVRIQAHLLPNQLYHQLCRLGTFATFPAAQRLLDHLDLLRDCGKHSLFQTVEFVEAAPGSHLAEAHKNTTHGLKMLKGFVAVEHQHKAAQLMPQGL
ncbi:unnamed protein product, partial [Ixodes pacificus]